MTVLRILIEDPELLALVLDELQTAGVDFVLADDQFDDDQPLLADEAGLSTARGRRWLSDVWLVSRSEVRAEALTDHRIQQAWRLPLESALFQRSLGHLLPRVNTGVLLPILGGCGGAGASTLAASLGCRAAIEGLRVAVVDLDPLGVGQEFLLGDQTSGLTWTDLDHSEGRLSSEALWEALPRPRDVPLLGFGVQGYRAGVRRELVDDVLRALGQAADLVLIDPGRQGIDGLDLSPLLLSADSLAAARATQHLISHLERRPRGGSPAGSSTAPLGVVVRTGVGGLDTAGLSGFGLDTSLHWASRVGLGNHLDAGLGPLFRLGRPRTRQLQAILDHCRGFVSSPESSTGWGLST